MREIKFRVWDKNDKKMIDIGRIDIAYGSCRPYIFRGEFYDYWNDVELMQYTGFKDIKGQEIYEGDILAHQDHWWIRIEYDSGSFMVRDVDKVRYNNKICNIHIGDFDISKWRVIGNICLNH